MIKIFLLICKYFHESIDMLAAISNDIKILKPGLKSSRVYVRLRASGVGVVGACGILITT